MAFSAGNDSGLGHLCGAYFHEDWSDDDSTWQAVVKRFRSGVPPTVVAEAIVQAKGLQGAGLSEDELHTYFVTELGSKYLPVGDALSFGEWLDRLIAELLC